MCTNFPPELSVRHEKETYLELKRTLAGLDCKVGALPPFSCVFLLMAECKLLLVYNNLFLLIIMLLP